VDHFVKEAIEIHLNKNTFNRDGGFILSQAWSPITNTLMNNVNVIKVHALINISYIYYMNVSELKRRTEQSRHLTPPTNPLVLPPPLRDKCITVHRFWEKSVS
jgi:hypothetical protein